MNLNLQMMRRLAYSLIAFLIGATTLLSADIEKKKVIEKSFAISQRGTVNIENKYGSVTVKEATSNEVKFKITIEVETNSESKAEDIFDRISINFDNKSDYVSAITDIEDNSSLFSWFSYSDGPSYKINYEVWMPNTAHLQLSHKYGDAYLIDLNNGLDLVMKYGNVVMGSVEGKINLDLGYGKIDFGDLGDVNADVKYSKLYGSSTQDFRIDSKYSVVKVGDVADLVAATSYDQYELGKVGSVRNDGKYDNWVVNQVENFTANSKYSNFEIDHLERDLNISEKYGAVKIGKVSCTEGEINLDVAFTTIEIGLNDCGADINYQGDYTSVKLPQDMKSYLGKDRQDTYLNEKFGNGERRMKINMNYGSLRIW